MNCGNRMEKQLRIDERSHVMIQFRIQPKYVELNKGKYEIKEAMDEKQISYRTDDCKMKREKYIDKKS